MIKKYNSRLIGGVMIYFVRHGQTDDNANGNLLTGWSATPLNERGGVSSKRNCGSFKRY